MLFYAGNPVVVERISDNSCGMWFCLCSQSCDVSLLDSEKARDRMQNALYGLNYVHRVQILASMIFGSMLQFEQKLS